MGSLKINNPYDFKVDRNTNVKDEMIKTMNKISEKAIKNYKTQYENNFVETFGNYISKAIGR